MTDLATRTEARTFGPEDLPAGESRRIYLKYASHNELEIREGTVIDSDYSKKSLFSKRNPAFKMRVTRRGTSKDGELEDVSYISVFPYKNLRNVERI